MKELNEGGWEGNPKRLNHLKGRFLWEKRKGRSRKREKKGFENL